MYAQRIARPAFRSFWGAALLAMMLPVLAGCGFNTIPTAEEQAKAAWSEVLNQYQRRADLIPNLVETVKGYAAHEKEVLESVVEARAKATQTTLSPEALDNPEAFKAFQESQAGLTGALSRLLAVVENYPDLKSSANVLQLQEELSGTENQISAARQLYNDVATQYNTKQAQIPTNLVAGLAKATPATLWEVEDPGERAVPSVDLSL